MTRYDYIIAGAGAAGLSLLVHMIASGQFGDRKILLVDRAPKTQNDRTWCFWEQQPGLFEPIIYKQWSKLRFYGNEGSSKMHDIHPYAYKMIRGIDFYEYCFNIISKQENISVENGTIDKIYSEGNETFIIVNGKRIDSHFIFSSIVPGDVMELVDNTSYFLWQHFKGWFIHTHTEKFDSGEATLMDFRIDQKSETRFVYVMPFSSREALVEYTAFSENRFSDDEYDEGLRNYCNNQLSLEDDEYTIQNKEFGMIPMTNFNFPASRNNIIYIGSAGGKTKASSGYTFRFIQKHSKQIVNSLVEKGTPFVNARGKKFGFYDSVLLKILVEKKLAGADVFSKLFGNNSMREVFKFLDNETSIREDLKLIGSLPKVPFISAAFSHLLK